MGKIAKILSWLLGVGCIFIMMAFSSQKSKNLRFTDLNIAVDHSSGLYFVKAEEVRALVLKDYPILDSLQVNEINIALLEESLDNHPSIAKAEVYSTLKGTLEIRVKQKEPIARIINGRTSYYLTNKGDSMKLSSNFSAKVPLVTGRITVKTQKEVFDLLANKDRDLFYKDFWSGIEIQENKSWVLYPEAGNHKVLLGAYNNVNGKLKKLKTFYQAVVSDKSINEIQSINLQYTNQVICQKHKTQ